MWCSNVKVIWCDAVICVARLIFWVIGTEKRRKGGDGGKVRDGDHESVNLPRLTKRAFTSATLRFTRTTTSSLPDTPTQSNLSPPKNIKSSFSANFRQPKVLHFLFLLSHWQISPNHIQRAYLQTGCPLSHPSQPMFQTSIAPTTYQSSHPIQSSSLSFP